MRKKIHENAGTIRVLQHLFFMAFSYLVLLQIFKIDESVQLVDHVYTLLFLLTILPVVYFNLEYLLPRLAKIRLYWYVILLAGLIAAFVWINMQLFDSWSAVLFRDLFFISYYNGWEISLFFITFIGITTLLKLSKSWFVLQEMQKRLLTTEKERLDMELLALKGQINPHFFFNTLNSIYSMSLDKDERLPATVLQLSAIMRYYLYESTGDRVPMEKEMQILKDYVELQRIRSGHKLDVQIRESGTATNKYIAPLLLLTFVENAFKHGAKGETKKSFIHIQVDIKPQELYFSVKNNKGLVDEPGVEKQAGIGLDNVKRRLQILYPNRHELMINNRDNEFSVELMLKL